MASIATDSSIATRLQSVTEELRRIQDLLHAEETVDSSILTDFRDAVNRVRNTAWAVEQYANSQSSESDPQPVVTLVAGERIRVSYQLCKLIQGDLSNPQIRPQKAQLVQFREVLATLQQQIDATLPR
ncbi:MAG TPA: hypothetical protein VGL89_02965 [Candidatus Koribacter sp.]|jgi:hypothetical protein